MVGRYVLLKLVLNLCYKWWGLLNLSQNKIAEAIFISTRWRVAPCICLRGGGTLFLIKIIFYFLHVVEGLGGGWVSSMVSRAGVDYGAREVVCRSPSGPSVLPPVFPRLPLAGTPIYWPTTLAHPPRAHHHL